MILDRRNLVHGAIPVGKVMSRESAFQTTTYNVDTPAPGLEWSVLPPSVDGYVLTCSASAAEGVAWTVPYSYTLPSALTGSTLVLSGSIATNGVTTPPAKAAFPGATTGTYNDDKAIIDAIVTILVNLGLCAASS